MRIGSGMFCLMILLSGCGKIPLPGGLGKPEASVEPPASAKPAPSAKARPVERPTTTGRIMGIDLTDPSRPRSIDGPVRLTGAKNETLGFTVAIDGSTGGVIRLSDLRSAEGGTIPGTECKAWQVVSVPVDTNRASVVRHAGYGGETPQTPRVLLPLPRENQTHRLTSLAQAEQGRVLIWLDLSVAATVPPGDYAGELQLLADDGATVLGAVAIELTVWDFVLPDSRSLHIVGQASWDDLLRVFPEKFEAIRPRLLNRKDPSVEPAVHTLDQLMRLAQEHRLALHVTRLQPTVKWPGGRPPVVNWDDYDQLVEPWLDGTLFADRTPLGFWLLPTPDLLENYDPTSRSDYWAECATHFDQRDWLARSAVQVSKGTPGRASAEESVRVSADAARILLSHPRIRAMIPLEEDQVQFREGMVNPEFGGRLLVASPGLIFNAPMTRWPASSPRPTRWLRTDVPGLISFGGTGADERDVRLWAWLAFVPLPPPPAGAAFDGQASVIFCRSVLPRHDKLTTPADPGELTWFYPGRWFGRDEPVPTLQLKWLRRAQQDFEYLSLARTRGQGVNALLMSRLLSKPVEIAPNQEPDPTFALMSGTADVDAWNVARELLARSILSREPGAAPDTARDRELDLLMLQWAGKLEQPVLMGRTVEWSREADSSGLSSEIFRVRIGIDLYNPSDANPDRNTLRFSALPDAWQVRPQPVEIPPLATYRVTRASLTGLVDASRVTPTSSQEIRLEFTDGYRGTTSELSLRVPLAICDRREGRLVIDGRLGDWSDDDSILSSTLVGMMSRPLVQARAFDRWPLPVSIFSGFSDSDLYVAFRVTGISTQQPNSARNFLHYQLRRAWGEDLVQVLVQPLYDDGSTGPVLHVACKPSGVTWVERKLDPRLVVDPWQPFQASVRYAMEVEQNTWRAELAIPWKAIIEDGKPMPRMLRFNFVQHVGTTGAAASWCGPVDFGRDDQMMGLLVLRER